METVYYFDLKVRVFEKKVGERESSSTARET